MSGRTYIAIDLKSFYASVECIRRGLDPMTTNLVVADESRTEKTICLAVSPSLKVYGIPGRARLFEVIQKVKSANGLRAKNAPNRRFTGSTWDSTRLASDPSLAIDYLIAPPRMAHYIEYSTRIYQVYLKHIAPEDIHVYSIDEVFMDVTNYLDTYRLTARELAMRIVRDVMDTTGITATAGIGSNLYLCKVAMDIMAKRVPPDENGVRIAELDEKSYRQALWDHRPLTDFWRVGRGYEKKLESHGLYTMGDIARCSLGQPGEYYNEELLYKLFGINAELLIDHAWGWEPCTISDIKAYRPESTGVSSGQVLQNPYTYEKAMLVVKEMADALALDLVEKGVVTDQITLTIGYDIDNLKDPRRRSEYKGEITVDHYGRSVPKHAHGTTNFAAATSSSKQIISAVTALYERITNKKLLIRRITVNANHLVGESDAPESREFEQLSIFSDIEETKLQQEAELAALRREKRMQQAMISIKRRFGKNSIVKGMSFEDGATAMDRNGQIGGHKA